MKNFFQQFVPALAAGMLVLIATFVLQGNSKRNDALAYSIYSTYIDRDELEASEDKKISGVYLSVVKIYNIGSGDASDFSLAISQIRSIKGLRPVSIKIESHETVVGKDIGPESIGSDGVLRIPVDKMGVNGNLTLRVIGNFGQIDTVDASKPGISVEPIAIVSKNPGEAARAATMIFFGGLLSIVSAFTVFLMPQMIAAYKRRDNG